MARAVIIGGGAAGFFAAITCAEQVPTAQVVLLEATLEVLAKVRISGGGRCNVTHDCLEPRLLVANYPRGALELRGPFAHFGPGELMTWFRSRGVELTSESDGRVFPQSNSSQTIIDCLEHAATAARVERQLQAPVRALSPAGDGAAGWTVETPGQAFQADAVLLATGSSRRGHALAAALGHEIVPPVPSLFTFTCSDPWIRALSGISVEQVQLTLLGLDEEITTSGPLLCTHWGVSGPAVLRASAWGARALFAAGYRCPVRVDWLGGTAAAPWLDGQRRGQGVREIRSTPPAGVPRRLWEALITRSEVQLTQQWSQVTTPQRARLLSSLNACELTMTGKGVFKEEFVTAGGVARTDIHWRTMESRRAAGLYFAGECVDVDAITGGFNFQNAWTTGYLAGVAMAERLRQLSPPSA